MPFIFVSAADGTNVVKTFKEAISRGLDYKKNPPEDYYSTVLNMLQEVGQTLRERMISSERMRRTRSDDR